MSVSTIVVALNAQLLRRIDLPPTPSKEPDAPARLTLAALAALVTAACGSDTTNDAAPESGSGSGSSRTVDVEMVDVAFEPAEVTVAEGETVTLRFTNTGEVTHDAFIGDTDAQDDHEMDMADTHGEHGASANDTTAPSPSNPATRPRSPTPSTRPAASRSAATNPATTRPA